MALPWLFGAGLILCVTLTVASIAGGRALDGLGEEARSAASLHAAVLRTEVEKYRSLPYVLAHDPDVRLALQEQTAGPRLGDPTDPERGRFQPLNIKFEVLSNETQSEAIYLLNRTGVTIAASRWRTPPSDFLGCQCGDRVYFTEAVRDGASEHFSKGRSRGDPGLYISHAVHGPTGPEGVMAVKVSFASLEQEWRKAGTRAFVTDENGVVAITSMPEWRFKSLTPLSEDVRAALTGQIRDEPLTPLVAEGLARPGRVVQARVDGEDLLVARAPVGVSNWTLHLMQPIAPATYKARFSAGVIALLSGLLALTMVGILFRRHLARRAEVQRQAAAREELEARVAVRTSELRAANERLISEMDERRRMETDLHRLQDELVQANKLTMLGQIAAGVAHEINQPVAAIKTYAENGILLLERHQPAQAAKNLGIIGGLTERISVITDELRAFAKRSTGAAGTASVTAAIDGALLLVSHRIRQRQVKLKRKGEQAGLKVLAERVRIEQVLVNLLQNSLDALEGQADSEICVIVENLDDCVRITVADNGPGMSAETRDSLFMPFVTTKPQGLGLGLVISREIMVELGGDLTIHPVERGSRFSATLRKAA